MVLWRLTLKELDKINKEKTINLILTFVMIVIAFIAGAVTGYNLQPIEEIEKSITPSYEIYN